MRNRYFATEAADSILGQSVLDFEFIIINDGSTDRTALILDSYQKNDPRVRVYHQENRGLVESLNRGCAFARGKYIARMDADDVANRDRLLWQIAFMEKHPEIGVLGGAVEFIDVKGASMGISVNPTKDHQIKKAMRGGAARSLGVGRADHTRCSVWTRSECANARGGRGQQISMEYPQYVQ